MVYNENGIILNEDYILDSIINEGMSDIANKVAQNAVKLGRAIADFVMNFIDYMQSNKYRKLIINYHKNYSGNPEWDVDKDDEYAAYYYSYGYSYWLSNFKDACAELKSNNNLSVEELEEILYSTNSKCFIDHKDEWFKSKETYNGDYYKDGIPVDDFLLRYNNNIKELRKAYSDIKVINTTIDKKPIKSEVMSVLYSYCVNAISAYKNITEAIYKSVVNWNKRGQNAEENYRERNGN